MAALAIDEAIKQRAIALVASGKSCNQVAIELGINYRNVLSWTEDIQTEKYNLLRQEALKLKQKNVSNREIARRLTLDRRTVDKLVYERDTSGEIIPEEECHKLGLFMDWVRMTIGLDPYHTVSAENVDIVWGR